MSIWTDSAKLVQTVLTLAKDLEQTRGDIKELKRDFLNLTLTVQRLSDEIKFSSQKESGEREKMALRLEMEMLKFKNRLLPAKPSEDKD